MTWESCTQMRGSRAFNNLTGMQFGPLDLFFLHDWIIEDISLETVGYWGQWGYKEAVVIGSS